jgi:6-phospho-beta-glucosidase
MKITIIGAAGIRTPLMVQALLAHQDKLDLRELSLMDIDGERLDLIGGLTSPIEQSSDIKFRIRRTADAKQALAGADFVITTFRVGGIESRVIDERVPLEHGILGQETTGAGGFAMGVRSIPVILEYVSLMEQLCPTAWLINFANPAGMLTEAIIRNSGWKRAVGICDAPTSMHQVISAIIGANPQEVFLDYFGLNHLGWIRSIIYRHQDRLPDILSMIKAAGNVPGLPFDADFIVNLGMIPNEYLYYYYYAHKAVKNILAAGESRGEQIARQNLNLFSILKEKFEQNDLEGMREAYLAYLEMRGSSYMVRETGKSNDLSKIDPKLVKTLSDEGYAGVALKLIEGLMGTVPKVQILNIPNQQAIKGMDDQDVVEIPAMVSNDQIQPLAIGEIPGHCMGLIKQVKHYERLTIEAAIEKSHQKARLALSIHPLVLDYELAGTILDEYISKHQGYFPSFR